MDSGSFHCPKCGSRRIRVTQGDGLLSFHMDLVKLDAAQTDSGQPGDVL